MDLEEILNRLNAINQRLERLERLVGTKVSQEKARKFLGISRAKMIEYRKKGLLPYRQEGTRIYYNICDLYTLI